MEVIVHEQEKRFYLAANGWTPLVGNEITIGKHSFCATPCGTALSSTIIISEVTSGAKLTETDLDFFDVIILDEKSRYLSFLKNWAGELADRLSERADLEVEISKMEHLAISKFGPKPPTEEIDFDKEVERVLQ